jgi:hypothetical protein
LARSKFESFFGFYFSFAFEFANLQSKEFLGRMVWGLTVMVSDSPGTNLSTVASIPRVGGASTTLTTNNNNPLHTCSLARSTADPSSKIWPKSTPNRMPCDENHNNDDDDESVDTVELARRIQGPLSTTSPANTAITNVIARRPDTIHATTLEDMDDLSNDDDSVATVELARRIHNQRTTHTTRDPSTSHNRPLHENNWNTNNDDSNNDNTNDDLHDPEDDSVDTASLARRIPQRRHREPVAQEEFYLPPDVGDDDSSTSTSTTTSGSNSNVRSNTDNARQIKDEEKEEPLHLPVPANPTIPVLNPPPRPSCRFNLPPTARSSSLSPEIVAPHHTPGPVASRGKLITSSRKSDLQLTLPHRTGDELAEAVFWNGARSDARTDSVTDHTALVETPSVPSSRPSSDGVRYGLRPSRPTPVFAPIDRHQPLSIWTTTTPRALTHDDIETFSDEDAAAFGFPSTETHASSMDVPSREKHIPMSSRPYLLPSSRVQLPSAVTVTTRTTTFAPSYLSTDGQEAETQQNYPLSGKPSTVSSNPWQSAPAPRRRLRNAAVSDTSQVRAAVKRKRTASTPGQPFTMSTFQEHDSWGSKGVEPPQQRHGNPRTNTIPEGDWLSQWNSARASGTAPRNDLAGGSGVGAGSYEMVPQYSRNEENLNLSRQEQGRAGFSKRSARGGRKRGAKGRSGWAKKGKSGGDYARGSVRGRRGRDGALSTSSGINWNPNPVQAARDDQTLQHVGGAEISF